MSEHLRDDKLPEQVEFMFDDGKVGYFEEAEFPSKDGQYHYMPYRGPGHYNMCEKLDTAGRAECWYDLQGERVVFTVQGSPAYGILQLGNFRRHRR